jgi:cytochrome c-type biogenesis protein
LIIGFGLTALGLVPGFQRQWGMRPLPAAGLAGAPVFGAVFALSWTPCVGPTLASVLTLAAAEGSTLRAGILAVAYCVGLGLPFMAVGLGLGRLLGAITWVRRHGVWVTRLGGAMLVLVGLALASGVWAGFTRWLVATTGVGRAVL